MLTKIKYTLIAGGGKLKVIIENNDRDEIEIVIRCKNSNDDNVKNLKNFIEKFDKKIVVKNIECVRQVKMLAKGPQKG